MILLDWSNNGKAFSLIKLPACTNPPNKPLIQRYLERITTLSEYGLLIPNLKPLGINVLASIVHYIYS